MSTSNSSTARAKTSERGDGEREFPFSEKEYKYLASIVYDRSGIVLGSNKINMVYSRLARRLRELQLGSFREYCDLLSGPHADDEIGFLINAITTNLTRFFRESHHFDHLQSTVLSDVAKSRGPKRLRIWSAACSSGEEPHSISMTLADALPDLNQWDIRILATDLDTKMVATGKAGLYSGSSMSDLPKNIRAKYFQRAGDKSSDKWQVDDNIRKLITFKHLNLLGPWPLKGPFDAIFCRNVMIYFDGPTKTALVERFAGLLKPNGWLYIGHAESLLDSASTFRLTGRTIYQKV